MVTVFSGGKCIHFRGFLIPSLLAFSGAFLGAQDDAPSGGASEPRPKTVELRGRLVCLPEEMARRFKATVQPVHQHVLGLRVDGESKSTSHSTTRYYTILRTHFSKALFEDPRYRKHTLVVSGRLFPGTAIVELTRFRWIREGALREVFYWCEVCSIKTLDPGPCACCQGDVEFRERVIESARPLKAPARDTPSPRESPRR